MCLVSVGHYPLIRKQKSQAIVDSLVKLGLFKDAMTIATYLPLPSEVDLSRLLG